MKLNLKIAIVLSAMLVALPGCVGDIKDTPPQPMQTGPVMGTKTPTAAIAAAFEQHGVYFWNPSK